MSFVSFEFIAFSAVVFPLYFLLRFRYRWMLLLVASLFFYTYGNGIYLVLLILTTLFDFWVAYRLDHTAATRPRNLLLAASILINFGILFFFKYFNLVNTSVGDVAHALGMSYSIPNLHLVLPIGISFYTFQEVAYVIDVYRRRLPASRNFAHYMTFVAFFPQLVAGPIQRATHLLPQFKIEFKWDTGRVVEAFQLILWGFFKKVVIADRLAAYVNIVYTDPRAHPPAALMIATIFFAFQIYCDFSGYTDIAIGLAKIMGFSLLQNFRQPYFATSIREFWSRWHISLSTWFRDYLYIPLGGNRVPFGRSLFNLMIVFLVSGLWHGANWTFVIWGLIHGVCSVIETILRRYNVLRDDQRWATIPKLLVTFAIVTIAWIFFRANSVSDALYVLRESLNFGAYAPTGILLYSAHDPGIDLILHLSGISLSDRQLQFLTFAVPWLLIALLLVYDYLDARWGVITLLKRTPAALRWGYYYGLAASILLLGYWGLQSFIYFQF